MGFSRKALRGCLALLLFATSLACATEAPALFRAADPYPGPHAEEWARHQYVREALIPTAAAAADVELVSSVLAPRLRREVFGFAPYWQLSSTGLWDLSLLTTIAYFGLDVRGDGRLDASGPGWTGWNSRQLVNLVAAAHRRGVKVVLTIKQFDTGTINRIVTDQRATYAAVTHTIDALASRGLDGVNVDFEGRSDPRYPHLAAGITHFMTVLSDRIHARWPAAEVSIDTYSGSASSDGGIFRIGDLAPHVDAFFVMAYDMVHSNMPGQAGPNAPLTGFRYNDTDVLRQYLARAPAGKVILGVPYYGYKWPTRDDGPYARATGGPTVDTYAGFLADAACSHLRRSFDERSKTPWASWFSPARADPCGANGNTWRELYYDDPGSLGLKYDLVNASGLRGVGIWALGYDGRSRDLWNVLSRKFR